MLRRRVLSSAAATLLLTLYLGITPSSRIINSVGFITHQLISNRFHCLIELAAFLSYTAATPRGRLRASWVQRCRGIGIFKCQKLHTAVSAGLCFCDSAGCRRALVWAVSSFEPLPAAHSCLPGQWLSGLSVADLC